MNKEKKSKSLAYLLEAASEIFGEKKLLPNFVTVRNGDNKSLDTVRLGNAKVLRARLSDDRFFYQEDQKSTLNKDKPLEINRGVELLLRNRRKKPEKPKTFQVKFGKLISLWNREIVFHINLYLDIRKT